MKARQWPLGARRALKSVHVAIAGAWLGAAVILTALQVPGPETVGDGLVGLTYASTAIDDFVIIPSALAVLLSGVFYGLRTSWGFVRFDWVIVKWLATLLFVAFGALFLGPWIDAMHEQVRTMGTAAWSTEGYQTARLKVLVGGGVQTLALGGLVFVSVFKPWGRR